MKQLKLRIEQLLNGVTTTNLLTGDKSMGHNATASIDSAKQFIQDIVSNAEPGEYYDIHITVSKQRNKKPA